MSMIATRMAPYPREKKIVIEHGAQMLVDGAEILHVRAFKWISSDALEVQMCVPIEGIGIDLATEKHSGSIRVGNTVRVDFDFEVADVTADCDHGLAAVDVVLVLSVSGKRICGRDGTYRPLAGYQASSSGVRP